MKSAGTVTRQDTSLEIVEHSKTDANSKKFERFKQRIRRTKPKGYQREDARSDKGDAMIAQSKDTVAWASTAFDQQNT